MVAAVWDGVWRFMVSRVEVAFKSRVWIFMAVYGYDPCL